MGRQLIVIKETRKSADVPLYIDSKFDKYDIRLMELTYNIYNFTHSDLTPIELINEGGEHHSEEGDACTDICICGHISSSVEGLTLTTSIKTHSAAQMTLQNPPLPDYLLRLAYNKKNEITTSVELWETDNEFNLIKLITTLE